MDSIVVKKQRKVSFDNRPLAVIPTTNSLSRYDNSSDMHTAEIVSDESYESGGEESSDCSFQRVKQFTHKKTRWVGPTSQSSSDDDPVEDEDKTSKRKISILSETEYEEVKHLKVIVNEGIRRYEEYIDSDVELDSELVFKNSVDGVDNEILSNNLLEQYAKEITQKVQELVDDSDEGIGSSPPTTLLPRIIEPEHFKSIKQNESLKFCEKDKQPSSKSVLKGYDPVENELNLVFKKLKKGKASAPKNQTKTFPKPTVTVETIKPVIQREVEATPVTFHLVDEDPQKDNKHFIKDADPTDTVRSKSSDSDVTSRKDSSSSDQRKRSSKVADERKQRRRERAVLRRQESESKEFDVNLKTTIAANIQLSSLKSIADLTARDSATVKTNDDRLSVKYTGIQKYISGAATVEKPKTVDKQKSRARKPNAPKVVSGISDRIMPSTITDSSKPFNLSTSPAKSTQMQKEENINTKLPPTTTVSTSYEEKNALSFTQEKVVETIGEPYQLRTLENAPSSHLVETEDPISSILPEVMNSSADSETDCRISNENLLNKVIPVSYDISEGKQTEESKYESFRQLKSSKQHIDIAHQMESILSDINIALVDHGGSTDDLRRPRSDSLYKTENVNSHVQGLLSSIDRFMAEEDEDFTRSFEAIKKSNAQMEKERLREQETLRPTKLLEIEQDDMEYESFSPYSLIQKRKKMNKEFVYKKATLHDAGSNQNAVEVDDSYCVIELDGSTSNVVVHDSVKTKRVKTNTFVNHAIQNNLQSNPAPTWTVENVAVTSQPSSKHATKRLHARRDQVIEHLVLQENSKRMEVKAAVTVMTPKERILGRRKAQLQRQASGHFVDEISHETTEGRDVQNTSSGMTEIVNSQVLVTNSEHKHSDIPNDNIDVNVTKEEAWIAPKPSTTEMSLIKNNSHQVSSNVNKSYDNNNETSPPKNDTLFRRRENDTPLPPETLNHALPIKSLLATSSLAENKDLVYKGELNSYESVIFTNTNRDECQNTKENATTSQANKHSVRPSVSSQEITNRLSNHSHRDSKADQFDKESTLLDEVINPVCIANTECISSQLDSVWPENSTTQIASSDDHYQNVHSTDVSCDNKCREINKNSTLYRDVEQETVNGLKSQQDSVDNKKQIIKEEAKVKENDTTPNDKKFLKIDCIVNNKTGHSVNLKEYLLAHQRSVFNVQQGIADSMENSCETELIIEPIPNNGEASVDDEVVKLKGTLCSLDQLGTGRGENNQEILAIIHGEDKDSEAAMKISNEVNIVFPNTPSPRKRIISFVFKDEQDPRFNSKVNVDDVHNKNESSSPRHVSLLSVDNSELSTPQFSSSPDGGGFLSVANLPESFVGALNAEGSEGNKQWQYRVRETSDSTCQISIQVVMDSNVLERFETETFEYKYLLNDTKSDGCVGDWVLVNCTTREIEIFIELIKELLEREGLRKMDKDLNNEKFCYIL